MFGSGPITCNLFVSLILQIQINYINSQDECKLQYLKFVKKPYNNVNFENFGKQKVELILNWEDFVDVG